MVKDLVKPLFTPSVHRCLPELLTRSPKFTETLKILHLGKLSMLLRDTTFM
jgi:hypothetical protein